MKALVLMVALAIVPAASWAVQKCTGADGKVVYSDAPCPAGTARPADPKPTRQAAPADQAVAQRQQVLKTWDAQMPGAVQRSGTEQAQTQALVDQATAAEAPRPPIIREMSFDACRASVQQLILSAGPRARGVRNVVVSPEMTMTRICTTDGSVLITCSRPDARQTALHGGPSTSGMCS